MSKVSVAEVAIESRLGGGHAVYTYRCPEGCKIGDGVAVPLANRTVLGFVVDIREVETSELGFPEDQLRDVSQTIDRLSLPEPLVSLIRFVSEEYLCPIPAVLTAASPSGAKERLVIKWSIEQDATTIFDLTAAQQEVLRTMREAGGYWLETKTKPIASGTKKLLRMLKGKRLVKSELSLQPSTTRTANLYRLCRDMNKVEDFLLHQSKKRPAQALVLMRLQQASDSEFSSQEIKAMAAVTESTIKALTDTGLLEKVDPSAPAQAATPPVPNPAQQLAIDAIVDAVDANEHRGFLLYGVTGSGKTEVYLRAVAATLRAGRQVLYLVPEIALATQAIGQLRARFGKRVAIVHSDLSPSERLDNWMAIRSGEAPIVLGARSALFSPLDNIGLIVVDEEHEASYKQESSPRYHSKALALFLGRLHRAPVVFGSATPSIESFFDAEEGRLTQLSLPERAADANLPTVQIEDLSAGFRTGKPSLLCPELQERIQATLDDQKQCILFLNRRAYSPFLMCRECGNQFKCPHCAVSLAYSQHQRRLRCHHCGFTTKPPDQCPKCESIRIRPFGAGTEKVEETVKEMYPNARVARLDRDVARRKGALEEILASFRSLDIDILVGTQMVAKGLDFPNVTLVGVIAADTSLNVPDFRSTERTFQLLSQVAGRAGRGEYPGHVVIQSFNPEHVAIKSAETHDYLSLYEFEKGERKLAGYPPFKRLVNLLFTGADREATVKAAHEAAQRLKSIPEAEVLGPVDCAIERIQNQWRQHVLIKLNANEGTHKVNDALDGFTAKGISLTIDIDPYSMI